MHWVGKARYLSKTAFAKLWNGISITAIKLLTMKPPAIKGLGYLCLLIGFTFFARSIPNFVSFVRSSMQVNHSMGIDERLTNINPIQTNWIVSQKGGEWKRYGWYLRASETGHLKLKMPGREEGILQLRVRAYNPGRMEMNVWDGFEKHSITEVQSDENIFRIPVRGESELIIDATNQLSLDQLVLDRVVSTWVPSLQSLPSPFSLVMGLVFFMAGFGMLFHSGSQLRFCLGFALIVVFAFIGFIKRYELFALFQTVPLEPDAVHYVSFAQTLTWFSPDQCFYCGSFGIREPLYIAILKGWSLWWGYGGAATRLLTVCVAPLLIMAAGFFTWRLSRSWLIGSFASLFMALNPMWIEESVRGLRTETEALFYLLTIGIWLWTGGWLGSVLLGIIVALLGLLRTQTLFVFVPLIWISWLLNVVQSHRNRLPIIPSQWHWKHLLFISLVVAVIYLPFLQGVHRVHGDRVSSSTSYASWLAKAEFPARFFNHPDPSISLREYFFGLHSVPTLIKGQLKGWIESWAYMSASFLPSIQRDFMLLIANGTNVFLRKLTFKGAVLPTLVIGLTLWGWMDLWRRRDYWWVPFLSLWGTWYAAYFYSARLTEPFRHTAQVQPLLLFCTLWGGMRFYQIFLQRKSGRT